MAKVYGSVILSRALKSVGVDTIFFLMGGPMLDTEQTCHQLGIKLIDVRHEQAAAMMAHAYSRVTGRPGVCMAGAGGDTINMATGIANAFNDACPLVAIGGSASLRTHAMDAFQDVDQFGVMKAITKSAWRVPTVEKIPNFVGMAFRAACGNKPGPVYLDVPGNVLYDMAEESDVEELPEPPLRHRPLGDWASVKQAVDMLLKAERPIILSGSGVLWSEASAELQELVNVTNIPFYTTPTSRGIIPEDHPMCFGGARTTAWKETNAILVVGTRASFILSYLQPPQVSAQAKIIMVNIDAEEIGHNRRIDVGIQGDAQAVLKQLIEEARPRFSGKGLLPWVERLRKVDKERQARVLPQLNSEQKPINPLRLMKEVKDFLPRDAILVVDGHHTLNFARQTILTYYPGHRLNPGVSGCMGVGVPFGIGAKAAKPDKPVMVLSGDGSFGFNCMEIDSAARQNLPVVVVINNNGGWAGMGERPGGESKEKDLSFLGVSQRYERLAEDLGGYGERVEEPGNIRGALERASASGKPAVVNVITDPKVVSSTRPFAADMIAI